MIMKTDYAANRKKLADRVKKEPVNIPIQEVRQIAKPKDETHVNFWMPTDLMDEIKVLSIRRKKTIKQLGIEAFSRLLKDNE
jgi:hypothetical protein